MLRGWLSELLPTDCSCLKGRAICVRWVHCLSFWKVEAACWTQLLYESTKLNYWSNLLTCCQRFLCDLKRDLCWVTSQPLQCLRYFYWACFPNVIYISFVLFSFTFYCTEIWMVSLCFFMLVNFSWVPTLPCNCFKMLWLWQLMLLTHVYKTIV